MGRRNKKSLEPPKESEKSRAVCSMCGSDKSETFIDLNTTEYLKSGLQKDWNLKPDLLKEKLSSICVECVCKLQAKTGRRKSSEQDPPARRVSTRKSTCEAVAFTKRKLSVSAKSKAVKKTTTNKGDPSSATNSNSNNSSTSDGLVGNTQKATPKWHTNLVCQYCQRSYTRRDYYTSHVRRCWRKQARLSKDGYDKEAEKKVYMFKKHCGFCGRRTLTFQQFDEHMATCMVKHKDHKESKLMMRKTYSTCIAVTANQASSTPAACDSRRRETIGAITDATKGPKKTVSFLVPNIPKKHFYTRQAITQKMSVKEYDLKQLDILKKQVKHSAFNCFVSDCGYRTRSLTDIMRHDLNKHWKCSWFYCHKCGGVFTSKVFLDYHLDRQNEGRYVCYKCSKKFKLQHQLDRHLVQHYKSTNYICKYCHKEFLSEQKLKAHSRRKRHNPRLSRKLIRIDRDMTIGLMPPMPPPEDSSYEARLLPLPSIPMSSKRPMQLPKHRPYRHFLGNCHYKKNPEPNCVGCQ